MEKLMLFSWKSYYFLEKKVNDPVFMWHFFCIAFDHCNSLDVGPPNWSLGWNYNRLITMVLYIFINFSQYIMVLAVSFLIIWLSRSSKEMVSTWHYIYSERSKYWYSSFGVYILWLVHEKCSDVWILRLFAYLFETKLVYLDPKMKKGKAKYLKVFSELMHGFIHWFVN